LSNKTKKNDNLELFTSSKKPSAVDMVINKIKSLLIEKKLVPGDKLPNENELAEVLSVSRGSVREALKILSAFGIIEIKRGDGTYIAKHINKKLFEPQLFDLILSPQDIDELVEVRKMIEKSIVFLVIENARHKDIVNIKNSFKCMKQEDLNCIDEMLNCDLKFHKALAKATHNELFKKIYLNILELFTPAIRKTYKYEKNMENAQELHKKIFEAIKKRDKKAAKEAVDKSIIYWEKLALNFDRKRKNQHGGDKV